MNSHLQIQLKLNKAIEAIQHQRLDQADQFIEEALKINSRTAEGSLLKGIVKGMRGLHVDAENCLKLAIHLGGKNFHAYFNLARALSEQNKDQEALAYHEKAVQLDPNSAEAWLNYANSLFKLRDYHNAIGCYDRVLQLRPDFIQGHINKLRCLLQMRQFELVNSVTDQILNLNSGLADVWDIKGLALYGLEKYEQASQQFLAAIKIDNSRNDIYLNLGNAYKKQNKLVEARQSYTKAIEIQPDFSDGWTNLGVVLSSLRLSQEALACHEKSLELDEKNANAWSNKGYELCEQGRYQEALNCINNALALDSSNADAWRNKGLIFSYQKNYEGAFFCFDQAHRSNPHDGDALFNKASLLLQLKQFSEGFSLYTSKWKDSDIEATVGGIKNIDLSHDANRGQSILLRADQGIGDEIFYASMLSSDDLLQFKITLTADDRLIPLFKRAFPGFVVESRKKSDELFSSGLFSQQFPMDSLGHLLRLDEQKISSLKKPYLYACPNTKSSLLNKNVFLKNKTVCGISWKSANNKIGDEKSIRLSGLQDLFRLDMSFVNLQYGDVEAEIAGVQKDFGATIHQADGLDVFNDLDGLLALIDLCDIVITTSNITAHLAGAAGKKAVVLLPSGKGRIWYWHENDDHSLWYPTLKLFSQSDSGAWEQAIAEAVAYIKTMSTDLML